MTAARTPAADALLVGVDGSASNRAAVEWAACEAEATDRALALVAVLDDVAFLAPSVTSDVDCVRARQVLGEIAAGTRRDHPQLRVTHEMQIGGTVTTLLDQSADRAAVVVGKRGLGAFGRMMLGSTSTGLAGRSRVLVEAHLRQRGIRDQVELVYVTPLPGAFTKPVAARRLGHMLDERGIAVEPDFLVERIDEDRKALVSYDEREVPFDLLVTVPLNKGADFVARSGLGDELNYVPVDRHTFLARGHDDIFAIGDANDIPTSKAGSVAHFSVDVFAENFLEHIAGRPMTHSFDGHANCFVESGDGKAMLIDFNYEVEPLPGKFPIPGIGPLTLLDETRANHLGKRAFQWIYWHVLLPGHPLPLPADMSMAGKHPDQPEQPDLQEA